MSSTSTTSTTKDTVYVDIDDDITSIIDKVNASDKKIVALVLPKRAAVLQSIVNMKLLKKTADDANKSAVLITSEAGLLPLAGSVGLHVAHNLQSKPAVPEKPQDLKMADSAIDEEDLPTDSSKSAKLDANKSVGELAGMPSDAQDDDAIELDNTDLTDSALLPASAQAAKPKLAKKDKKFKIPNFDKFRKRIALAVLVVILLVGSLCWAMIMAPQAKITIKTDSSTLNSNVAFVASTSVKALDQTGNIVPAQLKEVKKTDTQKVPATGQKDVGAKASGSVTMSIPCAMVSGTPPQVPAGTGLSSDGLTFITQKAVSVSTPEFGASGCSFTGTTAVVAQKNGEQYNLTARGYQIANGPANVTATGTDMTGGISKIVKVVSQIDIDNSKQKLVANNQQAATDELKQSLQSAGWFAIKESLTVGEPSITNTPNVGDEATDVTVISVTSYSMTGVKQDDLKTLVRNDAEKHIDKTKQAISDEGIATAIFQVGDKKPGSIKLNIQTDVKIGVEPDADGIKKDAAGKKKGDISSLIQNRPGVKDVTIDLKPFWVSKAPKNIKKITVVFEQNNAKP
jgi:hypothetical protein